MRSYSRLGLAEREEISRLLSCEMSIRSIGRTLNRAPSTVSREIQRRAQFARSYRACSSEWDARRKARSRRWGKRKLISNKQLAAIVHAKLKLRWSPQQIAQYLKKRYENPEMQVSSESIYTYVYVLPRGQLKKELTKSLRREHTRRKKHGNKYVGQSSNLEDMLSIEERPKEVADRSVPGHWEGDLIVGSRNKSVLGTLVERTTRSVILVPLKNRTASEVRKQFAKEMKKLPSQMRLSLTYDQGREMAEHKLFTKQTKIQVYFAHPRSPWERGTNENTNGLIRQFFPRGTDFNQVPRREIKKVQHLLNGRPRKTLDWDTPYEAMEKLLQ